MQLKKIVKKKVVKETTDMFYSDDGKYKSICKNDVLDYEAKQVYSNNKVSSFSFYPNIEYQIFKISSRNELLSLIWHFKYVDCEDFNEYTITFRNDRYFIVYPKDNDGNYGFLTLNTYIKNLKEDKKRLSINL